MPDTPAGFRRVVTLRVYCPVTPETFAALAAGQGAALETDAMVAPVLAAMRKAGLGDFGSYRGVFEAALGIEVFTPTAAASPVLGVAGETSHSPTLILTSWADADSAGLEAAIAAIAAAHPWEVPVIEMSDAWLRQG